MSPGEWRAVPPARPVLDKRLLLLAFAGLFVALSSAGQQSADEQAVWKLESAYWDYVKAVDLDGYRTLWHQNFVGWPSSSSQPARKAHITDWITAYTEKGFRLKWYSIEPAASQATENIVITHYWLTEFWADKAGQGEPPETVRITHTWIKTAAGWQILGGMSTPPPGK
ncbi:MAG: nuclear transport factor 2 family protein [Acidithiobacillales bacterium]